MITERDGVRLAMRSISEHRMEIAHRIRAHRIARGWTQREFATRTAIAFDTYAHFERTGKCSLDRLLRMLDILGLLPSMELVPAPLPNSLAELRARETRTTRTRVRSRVRSAKLPDTHRDPSA